MTMGHLIKQNSKSLTLTVFKNHNNCKMSKISVAAKYGFNYFKIRDSGNYLQIKPYQAELEKSRIEDNKSIINSVSEVRSDFETLKSEVRDVTENMNMDHLRQKMFYIEEKISCLKESIKEELLALLREEDSLFRDLHFIERKTEEWGKPIDVRISVKRSGLKVSKTMGENPTTKFQQFLSSSGGHYGGWEEQDHLLFLKERTKYKGKKKFLSTLHSLISDLSYEDIERHEKWYQKYECLRNSQREAIQKWKLEKDAQQKKQKHEDEKTNEKKQSKKPVRHQINIAERIKEWKNQQLLRKLEEAERQKKEKERLREEEKKKKEMQEIKKLAVTKYKAEKLSKAQEIFYKKENALQKQEAKVKNKILLKAFRLQDLKFIEKKKIIRLQLESKYNEKPERLKLAKPALEFILQRNPQRVFQPTLIWSQHCLESQKKEKLDPVFDLNSIPRLAIPEWRRELK